MATQINLGTTPYSYFAEHKLFSFSERHVSFAITYEVLNPKTGKSMKFDLSHSTGPEFDPKTCWIYFNEDKSITLKVANHAAITKAAAQRYLNGKNKRIY